MCMKPIHIFSNKNKNTYLPAMMLDATSKSESNADLNEHMKFLPIEYDPSIDPENMSQYLSKNYKVRGFYEKELIMDSNSNSNSDSDSESQLDLPPPYIEQQKLKTKHSPPPYKQFEQEDKESTSSSDDKGKRNWSAVGYCLIWLLIFFFLQDGMTGNHMGCHGQNGNGSDKHTNGHAAHNKIYNKATIVYSLTSDELKVDQVDYSDK